MISRLIDAFYWLGRYMERAENTARIVNVNYHASMYLEEEGEFSRDREDGPFSLTPWTPTDPESMVDWLILNDDNPSSVPACLSSSHRNAQVVRNKMDQETWECVNRAYIEYGSPDPSLRNAERLNGYCQNLLRILHEFTGTLDSNMIRTEGWYYLCLGRYLERADNCLRQLEVFLNESERMASGLKTENRNRLFLEAIGASMVLQKRSTDVLEDPTAVTSFLLGSKTSPRGFRYCLLEMEKMLAGIRSRFSAGRDLQFETFNELLNVTGAEEQEFIKKENFDVWLKQIAEVSDEFMNQFKQNARSTEAPARKDIEQFAQSQ